MKFANFVSFCITQGRNYSVNWGGVGEYSYIRVLPDEFLLKSVVFKFISKELVGQYTNI